jgi:pyruvate formate lyase activating enzyme
MVHPEKPKAVITNIQRFSLNDGPGIRTTVFLKGCPLHCSWCHNPECIHPDPEIYFTIEKCAVCGKCQEVCPEGAVSLEGDQRIDLKKSTRCMRCVAVCPPRALSQVGHEADLDAIMKEVESDRVFYQNSGGGMTISGGEPFFQFESMKRLLGMSRNLNIPTAIDTSGYTEWETFLEVLDDIDLILYDIKHIHSVRHQQETGVANGLILQNAERIAKAHPDKLVMRIPVIPGVNDTEPDLREMAVFTRDIGIKKVDLLPYHRYARKKYSMLGTVYPLGEAKEHTEGEKTDFEKIFKSFDLDVGIGG